jgi:hypothetical protein
MARRPPPRKRSRRASKAAAASQVAANTFQTQDTKVGADAIKDVLSSVSSMIGMFSGSMGSVNAVTSMLGQLTSTGVSTSTNLVSNLTGTLSHTGSLTHTASTPEHTDTASQSGPIGTAPLSGIAGEVPTVGGTTAILLGGLGALWDGMDKLSEYE